MSKYPGVDFKVLKHGEKEFFLGYRTLHPEEEKPRIKLKDYHRKIFYDKADEDDDDFVEFIEEKEEEPPQPPKLPEIPVQEEELVVEPE